MKHIIRSSVAVWLRRFSAFRSRAPRLRCPGSRASSPVIGAVGALRSRPPEHLRQGSCWQLLAETAGTPPAAQARTAKPSSGLPDHSGVLSEDEPWAGTAPSPSQVSGRAVQARAPSRSVLQQQAVEFRAVAVDRSVAKPKGLPSWWPWWQDPGCGGQGWSSRMSRRLRSCRMC